MADGPGEARLALQHSADRGQTWSAAQPILGEPEPVQARGEGPPKIALGKRGEIYIAYTKPIAKPHIGDIRFVKSVDGGRTFSRPVTVHANRDVITHSFESMIVDDRGRIFIAWIDGRDKEKAKSHGASYTGSALYYAVSHDSGNSFKGDYKIADHSCECCRIGLALNAQGKPVAMWRHVFPGNIRDHSASELGADGTVSPLKRVTFDNWKIAACPHHGPALAYGPDGVRHQVWFNGNEENGGASYASATTAGDTGHVTRLGSARAQHADVAVNGKHVAVTWKQFDGDFTAILARLSEDGGASWNEKELARTYADSDQPRLAASSGGIFLIWKTQNEGILAIPVIRGAQEK